MAETSVSADSFRFSNPRQERIYRRLLLIGPGPASFYRDACRLMAATLSLETTTHLVSHELREIESALRDVLDSVSERTERLTKKKGPGESGHEAEIRAILKGLEIPEADPVAQAWLTLPRKKASQGLQARAHRDALAAPRPMDEGFRTFWDEMEGTISFPPWPASRCLARMASVTDAQETILNIALQIPETQNVRVYEDLTDVALAMPANRVEKLVSKLKVGIESPYLSLLPQKLGALVSHLAKGGQLEVALDLARTLLTVLRDPRTSDEAGQDQSHLLRPEPRARFDTWWYERILRENVPDLVAAAGETAFLLLCDLLEEAICCFRSRDEDVGPEDYSSIWRPAIEDHDQNSRQDLKDVLVSAVRNAAVQIMEADPSGIRHLVETLEERPWRVFHRIALHLLRCFPEAAPDLIAERLTDRARFEEGGLRHEYTLLLRDRFPHLSSDNQAKILHWIEVGPDIEQIQAMRTEMAGAPLTDEEIERGVKFWRRDRLSPLRDGLPPDWRRRYDDLVAELGEPEHPDFVSYRQSWVGPSSPKNAEGPRAMPVAEIVAFLKGWQAPEDFMAPSPEGLGRELTAVVTSNPEPFAADATRFQGLDPTYVRALLWGFREAVNEKRGFPWAPVISLCDWVVRQPWELLEREDKYATRDPHWGWTRKTIADLLSHSFASGPAEIPFELREATWSILKSLTDDPNPTPEEEARYLGKNGDPVNLAINTTRGAAMEAVMRYALWVHRHLEQVPDDRMREAHGFDAMPEVREVLDTHLEPARDPSLAIRAVYGRWFPWLYHLDHAWTTERVPRIFPRDSSLQNLWDAAWQTYIVSCDVYVSDDLFEVLQEEYRHAVERVGKDHPQWRRLADPDEQLAVHLMALYWRGWVPLDDPNSLLARLYMKASPSLRRYALAVLGRWLYDATTEIPGVAVPDVCLRLPHRLVGAALRANAVAPLGARRVPLLL